MKRTVLESIHRPFCRTFTTLRNISIDIVGGLVFYCCIEVQGSSTYKIQILDRLVLQCSVTRKKHFIGHNAAFYIFDFLLYKLCIRKCRVSKHCFCRTGPKTRILQQHNPLILYGINGKRLLKTTFSDDRFFASDIHFASLKIITCTLNPRIHR